MFRNLIQSLYEVVAAVLGTKETGNIIKEKNKK